MFDLIDNLDESIIITLSWQEIASIETASNGRILIKDIDHNQYVGDSLNAKSW